MLSTYNLFILVVSLLVQHNLKYVISNAHCFGGIGCTMTEFSWDRCQVCWPSNHGFQGKIKPFHLSLYRTLLLPSFKDELVY